MKGHFHIDFINHDGGSQMRVETAASEVTPKDALMMLDAFMSAFGISEETIIMMLALRNGGVLSEIVSSKTQIELPSRFFKEDN